MQPTSIMLGQHLGTAEAEPTATEFQQVIGKVITVLSYRRWLFLVPLLLGILVSLAVSLCIPRQYVVNTIFERRDDIVTAKLINSNSPYSFNTQRRSMKIKLQGYEAISTAVLQLGLTKDFPTDENGAYTPQGRTMHAALVGKLAKCLDTKLLETSAYLDQIRIRYQGPDPRMGVALISRLRDNYIEDTQALLSEILHQAKEFFGQRQEEYSTLAVKLETELTEFGLAHPGANPDAPDVIGQRLMEVNVKIEDLTTRRADLNAKLATLTEYLQEIEQQPSTSPVADWAPLAAGAWLPNPERKHLEQEMDKVKTKIDDLKAVNGMTDAHPRVAGYRNKLEQLRIEFERTPPRIAAPRNLSPPEFTEPMSPLAREQKRVGLELKTLKQDITCVDHDLMKRKAEKKLLEEERGNLSERRQEFLVLKQDTQNAQNHLKAWKKYVDTVSGLLAAEMSDRGVKFGTVEQARKPNRPMSPTLGGTFLLSGGIGLSLAIALVFLREVFDRSFRDPAKVQIALGIPVLETIGIIQTGPEPGRFNRRVLMPTVVAIETIGVTLIASLAFLSLRYPEIYDKLMAPVISGNGLAGMIGFGT